MGVDDLLRVGFFGAGNIARVHLRCVADSGLADIVAICDGHFGRELAAQYGAAAYDDLERMMDRERMDALFVCVPPFAHGRVEEMAAEMGVHLLVEKPLGLDLASVRQKANAIRAAGIAAASGYCLRYLDTAQVARSYLQSRSIALATGYYHTHAVDTPWWREKKKSGGQVVEQATHIVDWLRYLAGDIERVQAFMAARSAAAPRGDINDASTVNLAFASGAVGHVSATFTQTDDRFGVEILGEGFRLRMDMRELEITEGDTVTTHHPSVDCYAAQDHAFLSAVATGDHSLIRSTYEDAAKTLAVTLAANRSAESGGVVSLKEF